MASVNWWKAFVRWAGELLGRPWWVGLGVILATTAAVAGYFLAASGPPASSEVNTAQPASSVAAAAASTPRATQGSAPGSLPSTAPASTSGGTPPDGTKLAAFSFPMSPNYTVVLGPTRPTYSQFTPAGDECDSGDLCNLGVFTVNNGNTLLALPGGSTPSYTACENAQPVSSMPDTAGTSFCVAETGLMVGVTVASLSSTPPNSSELDVTVWRNLS